MSSGRKRGPRNGRRSKKSGQPMKGLGEPAGSSSSSMPQIKQVWTSGVREELKLISELKTQFNHIAIAAKYPGNIGTAKAKKDIAVDYDTVKKNVNRFPPIQIAFTLFDVTGKMPDMNCGTWQFNMKLDASSDEATGKLVGTGFDIAEHKANGIEHALLSELLLSNGLVLTEGVVWIGFNSSYAFGYLLKVITGSDLPDEEFHFLNKFVAHFQSAYDIRYLMTLCKNLHGTLDQVATRFDFKRLEPQRFAGSDSQLVGTIFFKIKYYFFENMINDNYNKRIYNLNTVGAANYNHNQKQSIPAE